MLLGNHSGYLGNATFGHQIALVIRHKWLSLAELDYVRARMRQNGRYGEDGEIAAVWMGGE